MIKRIFATVSDKVFYAFREKAISEGLTMGEALASIAAQYALNTPHEPKKAKEAFNYVREHNNHRPTLEEVEGV